MLHFDTIRPPAVRLAVRELCPGASAVARLRALLSFFTFEKMTALVPGFLGVMLFR
jgi:hypothetical protein